ncbi:MAG: trypsin-like peptidase domain-containing protein [Polyangiaceae bacterium]|nr:trypsin-like peptidase domain-containing protein [Polyangiaceae bacterium]
MVGGCEIGCDTSRAVTGSRDASPASCPVATASLSSEPSRGFADLVARADPAVVSVSALLNEHVPSDTRSPVGEGEGSAFVYDPDGFILTNFHVIERASEIRVVLEDGEELKASIIGVDAPTDVAVLRVPKRNLSFLPLGDSDRARVGDWVVAIGNPFGLSHTVSAGIISAKGRTGQDVKGLGDESGYYNFIQTDASIHPGNSGGPLLDLAGRVVGINTAMRAQTSSIGFAIPINMVKELLPRLIRDGSVRRSAIGITVSAATAEDQARLGLDGPGGAVVRRVLPGGPADRAGLEKDDVVVALQGSRVSSPEQLRWKTSLAGVGTRVKLRLVRGKREMEIYVRLSDLSERHSAADSGID